MASSHTTIESAAEHSAQRGLLPFPGEIRNNIYRHVFLPSYKVMWPNSLNALSVRPVITADLAILRISKATSEEAMSLLYTECRFRYTIDLGERTHSPCPSLSAATQMNNIVLDVLSSLRIFHGVNVMPSCIAIVDMLAQTNRPREAMRIVFHDFEIGVWEEYGAPKESFLEALMRLKQVQVLLIEFHAYWYSSLKFAKTIQWVRERLEPVLGTAAEGEMEPPSLGRLFSRYLQFNPRSYVLSSMDG